MIFFILPPILSNFVYNANRAISGKYSAISDHIDGTIFHLLHFRLPNSAYYDIKGVNMENRGVKPFAMSATFGTSSLLNT